MAYTFRSQVVVQLNSTDPGRDYVTNVVYHTAPTGTAAALGDALLALFQGHMPTYNDAANLWVKVYNTANPLHSPPVYTAHHSGGGPSALGPRQVAVCVSFFSGLNVRGQRGRIYLGPWYKTSMGEYVSSTDLTALQALAAGLLHAGDPSNQHVIRHGATASYSNVSNYFVNNRWDTMRSRLPRETSRVTVP